MAIEQTTEIYHKTVSGMLGFVIGGRIRLIINVSMITCRSHYNHRIITIKQFLVEGHVSLASSLLLLTSVNKIISSCLFQGEELEVDTM